VREQTSDARGEPSRDAEPSAYYAAPCSGSHVAYSEQVALASLERMEATRFEVSLIPHLIVSSLLCGSAGHRRAASTYRELG
jgi:hypothetical protein